MFKNNKKDPLVDSVKLVMEQNAIRRQVESRVNEAFDVTSRRGLPHEKHAEYDATLEEAVQLALSEGIEALNELSGDTLSAYQAKLHKKSMFGFGKSPLEKARDKGDKGYHRDSVNRHLGNELASKKQSPLSTGVKVRATRPLEEEENEHEKDRKDQKGDKVSDYKEKVKKNAAGQKQITRSWTTKPGDDLKEGLMKKIAHVKSLVKEDEVSPIKESFERFIRNSFLKE